MSARKTTRLNRRAIRGLTRYFLELVEIIIIVIALSWFTQAYIIELVKVSDNSMLPTLGQNNQVLALKLLKSRTLEQGDVIAFYHEGKTTNVKRVIGLAGDEVKIHNGYVYVNNKPRYEPNLRTPVTVEFPPVIVPANHVFVLNDNRLDNNDSRTWGTIPLEKVIGEVMFCYWPWSQLKFL
ncbi:MAG: signal peptidase I [Peptococcaceae bacterium]|nr:signal peptidase I [Peptococcaceae bacterium]